MSCLSAAATRHFQSLLPVLWISLPQHVTFASSTSYHPIMPEGCVWRLSSSCVLPPDLYCWTVTLLDHFGHSDQSFYLLPSLPLSERRRLASGEGIVRLGVRLCVCVRRAALVSAAKVTRCIQCTVVLPN